MKQLFTTLAVIAIFMLACKKDKKELASLTTTAATNVTANSITSGGNITNDGHSAITKRGIAWATHAGATVGDSITNDGTGSGSFTSNITGLGGNSTYYLRAYAINASGTAYGNEISVTTAKGTATITTTAVSNIQPLSAVSGGSITNDGGAPITERGLVFATTANPTINNFKIVAGSGTGNFTATLQPLASQQTYYARAYATNSYGTAYGNQVQFSAASANTITDVDGNVYPYVTLCGKSWMATNLKTTKYKNGDPITNGLTNFDWQLSTTGAYSFPNGDVTKKDSFGLYYSIYAVNDARGICPAGWHLSTDDEWKALEVCQGMTQAQADADGLRGTIGSKFLEGGSTGLNIQLAGYLNPNSSAGNYLSFRQYGVISNGPNPTNTSQNYYRAFNVGGPDPIYRTSSKWVTSVRCVKD